MWFIILSDLFCFFFCLGGIYAGLGDLVLYLHCSRRVVLLHSCVTSVSFLYSQVPHIYGRVRLDGHSLVLLSACVIVVSLYYAFFPFIAPFFLVHLSFLSPYIESIWSSFSFVFSDVFASPMWAELNDVKAPSLRCLAEKLLEIVLASRADSTTLTYLNGFKRWRAWAQ